MKLKYNLQFFGEGENDDNNTVDNNQTTSDSNVNNTGDNQGEVNIQALADLVSEKDKQIQQLQTDMEALKKTNANLLVMVNSSTVQKNTKTFEESLLEMVGAKPRKE